MRALVKSQTSGALTPVLPLSCPVRAFTFLNAKCKQSRPCLLGLLQGTRIPAWTVKGGANTKAYGDSFLHLRLPGTPWTRRAALRLEAYVHFSIDGACSRISLWQGSWTSPRKSSPLGQSHLLLRPSAAQGKCSMCSFLLLTVTTACVVFSSHIAVFYKMAQDLAIQPPKCIADIWWL